MAKNKGNSKNKSTNGNAKDKDVPKSNSNNSKSSKAGKSQKNSSSKQQTSSTSKLFWISVLFISAGVGVAGIYFSEELKAVGEQVLNDLIHPNVLALQDYVNSLQNPQDQKGDEVEERHKRDENQKEVPLDAPDIKVKVTKKTESDEKRAEELKKEKQREKEEERKREEKKRKELEAKIEAEKKEQERKEKERKDAERREAEKKKKEEAERKEKERIEAERKEKERLEAEKRKNEQKEAEKKEQERKEAERKEQERKEAEKKEQVRKEAEKKEQERKEAEKKEQERREAEKREQERKEAEKKEQERKEAEKKEQERKEAEKREQERKEAERKEQERNEAEKKEQERKEAERKEQERKEAEKREQERKEAERKEAEKREQERKEAEKREQERKEAEKREQERKEAEIKKQEALKKEEEKKSKEHKEDMSEDEKNELKRKEALKKELERREVERKEKEKAAALKKEEEMREAKRREALKNYAKAGITNVKDMEIMEQLDEADDLLEKQNFEEALKRFDAILNEHPDSPRAVYGKGLTLDKLGFKHMSNDYLEQSITFLDKVLSLKGVPDDLFKMCGRKLAERQQFRGWGSKAVKTYKILIETFPDDLKLLNEFGVQYLLIGQNERAREVFKDVLVKNPNSGFAKAHLGFILKNTDNDIVKAIPLLREGIDSGEEGTSDGRFYVRLGDALLRIGNEEEARHYFKEGESKGLLLSEWQRSLYNVNELTGRPFWTPEQAGYVDYVKLLEENWQVIRDEGLSQLNVTTGAFVAEDENLRDTGDWKQLNLYIQGRKNKENCARTPKTCALIDQIPEAKGCRRGQVKFSVMSPGIHVWPHTGPTNCRLRGHLGLVVPAGPLLRVVKETRTWKEGEMFIFDDSFEHEVWHSGSELRLVLIVDFWHPELTERQRRTLTPI